MTRSVKQRIVSLHSTDSEVVAVVEAGTYVLWLRILLGELGLMLDSPIPVYQDNQSAIFIYRGNAKFRRSKHLLTKQHYILDLVNQHLVH
jgi:hypothetical protein